MSFSALHAQNYPNTRKIFPDGIFEILAIIGLGSVGPLQANIGQLFGGSEDARLIDVVRKIQGLNGPGIAVNAVLFFTIGQRIIPFTYYEPLRPFVNIGRVDFTKYEDLRTLNEYLQQQIGVSDILPPDMVQGAFATITSVLRFQSSWKLPFDPSKTALKDFEAQNGSRIQIPMMQVTSSEIKYYQIEQGYAVELEFENGAKVEFLAGLPATSTIDMDLPYANSGQIVRVEIPSFIQEETLDLQPLLTAAGFGAMFQPGSLERMIPSAQATGPVVISKALQRIAIDFRESGTAEGATKLSSEEPTVVLQFNRPFHYRLRKDGFTLAQGYINS